MAAPRPTAKPDWSSAPTAGRPRIEPTNAVKASGFEARGRVPAATLNWLLYSYDQWIDWFDETIANNAGA